MLNEEQIEKLRHTFATNGWNDVIVPVLANRAKTALEALIQPPSLRGERPVTDEDLRAMIREIEHLLTYFQAEIRVFEQNRQRDELARAMNGEQPTPANP